MTWYREVIPKQEPFDNGTDESGRSLVVFNIDVIKRPSATFLEEITALLEAADVGDETNIFQTNNAEVPGDGGPYMTLIETGGVTPERTQNAVTTPAYQRPSMQIVVRSPEYDEAMAMSRAAYDALVGVRNVEVTP